jgi:hypothetical protein
MVNTNENMKQEINTKDEKYKTFNKWTWKKWNYYEYKWKCEAKIKQKKVRTLPKKYRDLKWT